MKRNTLSHLLLLVVMSLTITATVRAQKTAGEISFGVIGGLHSSSASYSHLPDGLNDPKSMFGYNAGLFAEFELSPLVSLRPQLSLLTRGSKIESINTRQGKSDYSFNAKYTDFRLPVMFNFGSKGSISPYMYVAPTVGFVYGGKLKLEGAIDYEIDVTQANMANTYFAITPGVGVKFPLGGVNLGVEMNYELGLTDTYGSKEKDGKAHAVNLSSNYTIDGTRKMSGFEFNVFLSVPLSTFSGSSSGNNSKASQKGRQQAPKVQQPVRQNNQVRQSQPRKAYYTLEEVKAMSTRGERLKGVTINAASNITFASGKTALSAQAKRYLDRMAQFFIEQDLKVDVRAHTDSQGADDVNMRLSEQRAEAVYNYLVSKGVKANRLSYSFYGETQPIQSNDTDAGRRANRRVEFVIK